MPFKISEHLNENNFHHAYLIEGKREEIVKEILEYINSIGIETSQNSDFYHISQDVFKIEDAKNLKSISLEKSFSSGKRIFLISTNNFLLDAQNTLLKIFEEPIENTVFFIVMPSSDILLKTFVSRFYLIKTDTNLEKIQKDADKFLGMQLAQRISFIKDLIVEEKKEDETDDKNDSIYIRCLNFLNALEISLHNKLVNSKKDSDLYINHFAHLFKVREFLYQPGSSKKTLMESLALAMPIL